MIDFVFEDNAIKVAGLPLWLDSSGFRADKTPVRRSLNFTSHAHADHLGKHKTIICSPPTYDLIRARQKIDKSMVLEFGEECDIAGASISLYPAGHVLGSAQILIKKDGHRLCYTGDFRLGKGLTSEECQMPRCDTLLMECTYGSPRYTFPPREQLLDDINTFVEQCFDDCVFPVLLGYSLGKAQEIVKACEILGYGVLAHKNIYQLCQVYKKHGVDFDNLSLYGSGPPGRRVFVFPPHKSTWQALARHGDIRSAILSGWATETWRNKLFSADAGIPYSDHCDFNQLIESIRLSGASKVYTHHGNAEEFADHLQNLGIDAKPLIPRKQHRLF
jgi:Cft2 family RNA processing exonuclease